MTDRAPSSALAGSVPSGRPSPLKQHARLGGEGEQELREVGRGPGGSGRARRLGEPTARSAAVGPGGSPRRRRAGDRRT